MKWLRLVLALMLVSAVTVLTLCAHRGIETDLYGLADADGVLGKIAKGVSGQGRVLLEGDDFGKIKCEALRICKELDQMPKADFKETLKFLDERKDGLLASETREQLKSGKYGEVADAALARLFSPMPRLFSVKDDPFLLATEYVTELQTNLSGDWSLRDGFVTCERNDRVYVLLSLDLAHVPAEKLVSFIKSTNKPGNVYLAGPPFHSAMATVSSKREIEILSCVSIVCVLGLGWLLFGSFKFLPMLLFAQGTAFLTATAALFAVFNRPHVLTFVFGTSLIGLSVDYVYHVRMAGGARRIMRPLTLSLLTTMACFSPLLFADVIVLRQMALFTIVGLGAAYWTVVCWNSEFGIRNSECVGNSEGGRRKDGLHLNTCFRVLIVVLVAGLVFGLRNAKIVSNPASFYKPDESLAEGEMKIAEVYSGHAQRFAFVPGETLQDALEREEVLGIKGLSAVIPSLKRQRENVELKAKLVMVEGARYVAQTSLKMPTGGTGNLLDAGEIVDGPLSEMVRAMWVGSGLVSPIPEGVDVSSEVEVIVPREAIENLFAGFTSATLKLLAFSFAAFVLILTLIFRRKTLCYLAPVVLALSSTAGALCWLGVPFTFFTLLCFFVLTGLGIDYVIFNANGASQSMRRTVRYSFLTSFVGLGILAFTGFPVTQTMGITFAIGLTFAWGLSELLSAKRHDSRISSSNLDWHRQKEQSAGVLRLRIMWLLYSWCGKNVQKVVTFFVMLFVYPFAKPARNALAQYYEVLEDFDPLRFSNCGCICAFRHLLGFAWSLSDKTDACTLKKNLPRMEVRDDAGWRAFRNLTLARKGAFLISTHLGVIEVLPALAAFAKTPVPHVHAFQQMGHDAAFTQMFMKHFDANAFTLHAVEQIGVETAVEMQDAIMRGEFVLMAGDRVSAGSNKILTHDFLNRSCRWPKGVFTFAKLMEAPVFFVTCVRIGWNAYECHFAEFKPTCKQVISSMLDQYVNFLQDETLAHPEQWYQFYDFFAKGQESSLHDTSLHPSQ